MSDDKPMYEIIGKPPDNTNWEIIDTAVDGNDNVHMLREYNLAFIGMNWKLASRITWPVISPSAKVYPGL